MREEVIRDCKECEHMEVTYREHDTGYEEWCCNLYEMGCDCQNECPLNFRYEREEE